MCGADLKNQMQKHKNEQKQKPGSNIYKKNLGVILKARDKDASIRNDNKK